MKTAIVYYSMSGNTERVAEEAAKALNADLVRLVPQKAYPDKGFKKFLWGGKSALMGDRPALEKYDFDGGYDLVVIGSPVWAGTFAPPLRTFLADNKEKLSSSRFAAFLCLGGKNAAKAFEKIKKELPASDLVATEFFSDEETDEEKTNKLKDFCKKLSE